MRPTIRPSTDSAGRAAPAGSELSWVFVICVRELTPQSGERTPVWPDGPVTHRRLRVTKGE
jgi:hypothetical protein